MNTQDQQRLYLQTIFDYFHENTEWPTYRYVDRKLFNDAGIDAKEIAASLPDGFANGFRFENDLGQEATLSLEAIRTCSNSEGDLADFLTVVRSLVERYKKAEEDNPLLTGADLKNQLAMTDKAIARVGKLIAHESIFCGSSGEADVNGYATWQCSLGREIRRFDGVASIEDYLERRDKERIAVRQQATNQLKSFLGYMYRKPGSDDAQAGMAAWTKNLTEPNKDAGEKLEVALLNALARLGVPTLFGGDVQRVEPKSGEIKHSGPATSVFDLVALNFGAPMHTPPTAVLISCKSTANQPQRTEIAKLSDESSKVRAILPEWQVFGAYVSFAEPTADEFNYRQDVRIWKGSHLQALLNAKEHRFVAQFLWTPPWHWNSDQEIMWWNIYRACHKEVFSDE